MGVLDTIANFDSAFLSFGWAGNFLGILRGVVLLILFIIIVNFILNLVFKFIRSRLMKTTKSKKHVSNIEIFTKASKYLLLFMLVIFAIFSYTGAWTSLGISVGLLSAALGLALQRPIMGIAGWFMILTKRPFEIGDRVMIGAVKGDVEDITLTHVYLRETGGQLQGEDYSGRIVLVPNSVLFEQNVINYTTGDDYILDEVFVTVKYTSNLDKAVYIAFESAKKFTKDYIKETGKDPIVRIISQASGVDVIVRYYAPVTAVFETSSKITKEIIEKINEAKDVEIAYPHTEVILRDKKHIQ